MEVAIKAAREVGAEISAPELFRVAVEAEVNAQREYKLKNFKEAKEFADKSRTYAERAEFESIRNGQNRVEAAPVDPLGPVTPAQPDTENK